jgi:hypothetical protein
VKLEWQVNNGIKPKATRADLRFAGDPGLPEQLNDESIDDWYWELRLGNGRISHYRITEA